MISEISIVSGIFPPDVGGPATFTEAFSWYESKGGTKVNVISTHANRNIQFFQNRNLHIRLINRNTNLIIRTLRLILEIKRKSKTANITIANGAFIETLIALTFRFRGKPYLAKIPGDIVWERACSNFYTNKSVFEFQQQPLNIKYKVLRFLFTLSLKKSERIIVPAPYLRDLCISWGVPENKLFEIGNTVDTELFRPSSKINKIYDVITVSRLVPVKQIDALIQACSRMNLSLAIVGDGPLRKELEELAQRTDSRVTFLGQIAQNDLPKIYSQAKVFVLNSKIEATSYSLLEARSSGLISIANCGTGSEDVIRHLEDGILCGEKTGFELEGALEYVFSEKFDWEKGCNLARSLTINEYDRKLNFNRINELLLEVAQGR
jgi:glycosyltransferase involved in cell wall biosynthesis